MSTPSTSTVVRVLCQWCGPVRVRPGEIQVLRYPSGATYAFTCGCGRRTAREARPAVLAQLRSIGCPERRISLPPRQASDAPPISADELLDMVLALRQPGWERELLGT